MGFKSEAFTLELLALSAFRNLSYLYFVIYLLETANNCLVAEAAWAAGLQGALLACPGKAGWGPPRRGQRGTASLGTAGHHPAGQHPQRWEALQGQASPLLFHILKSHFPAPQLMSANPLPSVPAAFSFLGCLGRRKINK